MNKLFTLFISVLLFFGASIAVLADDVPNNLDLTIDSTLESLTLAAGGPTGSVTYNIVPRNGDGKNGCNLTGATVLSVATGSSNNAIATVSPASLTFTSCSDTKTITVTPIAGGTANVTLTQTTNTTAGTFNLAPASFTVDVTPAVPTDSTPPVITPNISPAPNANGWNNSDVSVSWDISDGESSIIDSTGCEGTVVDYETAGVILTCQATSAGGTTSESVTIKVDKTAPVITGTALPAANINGWNNTDVTVGFICADTGVIQSGIDINNVAGDTLTSEGAGQFVTNTGDCIDLAGNVASQATVSDINIDKTAPAITINTPLNGANYTFNQAVLADWTAGDDLSGLDGAAVGTVASGSPISTTPVGSKSFEVTATDLAGNTQTQTVNYTVVPYKFSNFLAPLTIDSKTFKKTSTIPVKFQLRDVNNNFVTNAVATLKVDTNNAIASGSSNVSNFFRFDLLANQYIFNLSTKQLSIGTHVLKVTLDDGKEYTQTIVIR